MIKRSIIQPIWIKVIIDLNWNDDSLSKDDLFDDMIALDGQTRASVNKQLESLPNAVVNLIVSKARQMSGLDEKQDEKKAT